MARLRILAAVALCCGCLSMAAPLYGQAMADRMDLHTFHERVRVLRGAIEQLPADAASVDRLNETIPPTVMVAASTGEEYRFSFAAVKEALAGLDEDDPQARAQELVRLSGELARLEQRLAAYEAAEDTGTPKARLGSILNRREFANVQGQSWTEHLREEVVRWLLKMVQRLLPHIGSMPDLGRALVIFAMVLALAVLAYWSYRLISRIPAEGGFSLDGGEAAPSSKHWRTWLAEANAAAAAGQWREAIRLAYWAAISRLESAGAWRPDRARTPREYLQLLGTERPEQGALREITRRFELAWYAQLPVTREEFAAALENTEQLGCR
jgi:hypothetical protein